MEQKPALIFDRALLRVSALRVSVRAKVALDRPSLPDWPRLMSEPVAAEYVSIGVTTLRNLGPAPRRIGRRRLYDRHDLDRWADRLGGQPLTVAEQREESAEVERRFLEKRRARG